MLNVHVKCKHFETKNFRIRVGVLRVQCAYFVAMLVVSFMICFKFLIRNAFLLLLLFAVWVLLFVLHIYKMCILRHIKMLQSN